MLKSGRQVKLSRQHSASLRIPTDDRLCARAARGTADVENMLRYFRYITAQRAARIFHQIGYLQRYRGLGSGRGLHGRFELERTHGPLADIEQTLKRGNMFGSDA